MAPGGWRLGAEREHSGVSNTIARLASLLLTRRSYYVDTANSLLLSSISASLACSSCQEDDRARLIHEQIRSNICPPGASTCHVCFSAVCFPRSILLRLQIGHTLHMHTRGVSSISFPPKYAKANRIPADLIPGHLPLSRAAGQECNHGVPL